MPWYTSGTVSVTLNSNAVIGTGTAFLSNGRVGDAFRGPDGGWYEVTNIASDTAMSISPVYKGATNPAGAYALAPMQGYVKDSADALRALVNTYGVKLAALGTTGNYDVLPASKGGTGLTAVGTAVSANVTTSVTDTTLGRLLHVGDLGLGARIDITGVDLNTVFTPGGYWHAAVPAAPNSAVASAAGYIDVSIAPLAGSIRYEQLWRQLGANGFFRRTWNGSTWSTWEVFAKGGANADITSLSGLTTPLSVAQGGTGNTTGTASKLAAAAMVGTVSQASGIPTGAIIESGSNSLGTYTKFADGTMIATTYNAGPWSVLANTLTVLGPFGTSATFANGNYSVAVTAAPSATNDTFGVITAYAVSNSSCSFVFRNGATSQNIGSIKITCIGRWY